MGQTNRACNKQIRQLNTNKKKKGAKTVERGKTMTPEKCHRALPHHATQSRGAERAAAARSPTQACSK